MDDFAQSSVTPFVHKLPQCLKSLEIFAANELLEHELMRLASKVPLWLPSLKLVEVDHRYETNVIEAFRDMNVELKLGERYGFSWFISKISPPRSMQVVLNHRWKRKPLHIWSEAR